MNFDQLESQVKAIIEEKLRNQTEKLQAICDLLHSEIPYYTWVGFYFADAASKTLHLGPFAGMPTDHIAIPFGKGICGQVAVSNQNFIVPDVHAQDNYIACSLTVKSEIVIPLFVKGQNIGQIDIDSDTINAFTDKDEAFLVNINKLVGDYLGSAEKPKIL
jgi:L-methionine (R)-S-oxide reductase